MKCLLGQNLMQRPRLLFLPHTGPSASPGGGAIWGPSLLGRALRLPRQVVSGSPLYAENNPFSFVQKDTDPLLCVCSRGCSWLKVPLARNPPVKPWAGTKIPVPVEWPPERDWALWGQRVLWAAWRGSPSCRLDLIYSKPPAVCLPRGRIRPRWYLPPGQFLFSAWSLLGFFLHGR